jgi:RimJ/RimL family protein N-acetyltransferase
VSKTKPSAQIDVIAPFPDVALPLLWMWIEEARSQVADDFSPQTPGEFIALERQRAESGEVITFAIYRDHELGGYVRVVPTLPMSCEAHCIFSKSFYGYQTTLPALNDVARQLFEAGIERLTLPVFAHNTAIRSLLKRGGAVEEGTLRSYTRQNNEPVDMVIFGLLKSEWLAKQDSSFIVHHSSVPLDPAPKLDD